MTSYYFQIALFVNLAFVASAHIELNTHAAFESTRGTSMMRREPPKQKNREGRQEQTHQSSQKMGHVSINAQGSQNRLNREQRAGGESVAELGKSAGNVQEQRAEAQDVAPPAPPAKESKPADATPKVEPQHREAGEAQREEGNPKGAVLAQQEESSQTQVTIQRGEDEKKRNPARLSDADEELYYRLFPEDREVESKGAVSALELTGKKAFRIKVPVSGGKRLCLTEENHGYKVRAEPCRRNSQRQKWYWIGSKLKNLFSRGRCLGMAKAKHHIGFQTEGLIQRGEGKAAAEAQGNHLSMSFHCSDAHAPLSWVVDEHGRLKSNVNSQCMAINEEEDFHALVLPCEKATVM